LREEKIWKKIARQKFLREEKTILENKKLEKEKGKKTGLPRY
jgi:hypothetical protein